MDFHKAIQRFVLDQRSDPAHVVHFVVDGARVEYACTFLQGWMMAVARQSIHQQALDVAIGAAMGERDE